MVDTQVANALVHAAQEVRLLETQVILTGIKPQVAQTLVQLGVSLEGHPHHRFAPDWRAPGAGPRYLPAKGQQTLTSCALPSCQQEVCVQCHTTENRNRQFDSQWQIRW